MASKLYIYFLLPLEKSRWLYGVRRSLAEPRAEPIRLLRSLGRTPACPLLLQKEGRQAEKYLLLCHYEQCRSSSAR